METGLPAPWEIRHSKSRGLPYYFNTGTQDSRWEPPAETDIEKLKHYMAAHHSELITSRPDNAQSASGGDGAQEEKIRAAHLLVKHNQSRRPKSWKEDPITRSKDEAMSVILGYEQRIRAGETTLAQLASTESDCPSARKGGDLGFFGRGDMQQEFEEAAFNLKVGDMSHVVDTNSGLHLIERLA